MDVECAGFSIQDDAEIGDTKHDSTKPQLCNLYNGGIAFLTLAHSMPFGKYIAGCVLLVELDLESVPNG